ncbi:LacI family DNA-binding transcriptional regulator [Dermatophilus congolensis]|uniref:HTH-type transcriptional repressor CytR n=1 Tax=Dermatophilus congolensis TaxID=1863 RepID=A0A239V8F2_9MICO|nr:LacI family DNA-binding transcriptional regulator [Dermatophilus congolensis]MBO3130441.1 LacI family transcriptional regulator [Dermatophilus congolensis]MBO3130928.1 LacI family transcriptional regulator [Dermatophilus congolensis]MBO3134913.1 LacI family transcriptional regulator [Dermatophilus congolensis]MBO3137151.1 LacI family transcriptional regulator [Dermatophilus congolensis]MBO3139395.1 LacI family transcriptional regulator [Dermatophilus congolensis]
MTTIRDVAALAGVSVATVSRALSGSDRVTPATRQRVQAAAAELHYHPNAVAAAMRTGRTGTIGLVVASLANPFITRLAASIEAQCRARGWTLTIATGSEDPDEQARVTSILLRQQVDGLFIVLADNSTGSLDRIAQSGTPIVAIDRRTTIEAHASILNDPTCALEDLATHLYEQGYQRPAIISGPTSVSTGHGRAHIALQALTRAGYNDFPIPIHHGDFTAEHGTQATTKLLESPQPPDVIVALSNLVAQGALHELQRRNIDVGPQIGLTAYDDEPWFELTNPPLTCVTQPVTEMAQAGIETLAALIEHKARHIEPAPLTGSRLIIRQSTCRRT